MASLLEKRQKARTWDAQNRGRACKMTYLGSVYSLFLRGINSITADNGNEDALSNRPLSAICCLALAGVYPPGLNSV